MINSKTASDQYRVVGRMKNTREGWGGYVRQNVLQKRIFILFGLLSKWVDVEYEDIPQHVEISLGCCGDTGGWKSKFNTKVEF